MEALLESLIQDFGLAGIFISVLVLGIMWQSVQLAKANSRLIDEMGKTRDALHKMATSIDGYSQVLNALREAYRESRRDL